MTREDNRAGGRLFGLLAASILIVSPAAVAGEGTDTTQQAAAPTSGQSARIAEEASAADKESSAAQAKMPPNAAGMVIYVDPETGEILPGPPDGEAVQLHLGRREQEMLSHSELGLFSQEAPGGGIMVDLEGRFRSLALATVAADGSVKTHCLGGLESHAAKHAKSSESDEVERTSERTEEPR